MANDAAITQVRIRIREGLRLEIEQGAAQARRSANQEYAYRLEQFAQLKEQVKTLLASVSEAEQRAEVAEAELDEAMDSKRGAEGTRHSEFSTVASELVRLQKSAEHVEHTMSKLTLAVNSASETNREVSVLEKSLRADTANMQSRLLAEQRGNADRTPTTIFHSQAAAVVEQIDERTAMVVKLALTNAGVDDNQAAAIQAAIAREHSLIESNRTSSGMFLAARAK